MQTVECIFGSIRVKRRHDKLAVRSINAGSKSQPRRPTRLIYVYSMVQTMWGPETTRGEKTKPCVWNHQKAIVELAFHIGRRVASSRVSRTNERCCRFSGTNSHQSLRMTPAPHTTALLPSRNDYSVVYIVASSRVGSSDDG
jgi:hypothetical protein